jgi:hypothetical protein
MNPRRRIILFVACVPWVVVVLLAAAYYERIYLSTWLWHLRNGTTLTYNNLLVPVPAHWHVERIGDDVHLIRLDTADRSRTVRMKSHAIVVLSSQQPVTEAQIRSVMEMLNAGSLRRGLGVPKERTIRTADGVIICSGGDFLDSGGIPDSTPVAWDCQSTLGVRLTLLYAEADGDQTWDIVSGMSRKQP